MNRTCLIGVASCSEAEAAYFEQGAEAAFEYAARAANNAKSDESSSGADVFSLTNVKKSIESAVHDMASLPENEQRKKIKQLRLRWHPDKNPVLGEFAAEVTKKIINESVGTSAEEVKGGDGARCCR
jgi:hypothetical protein